MPDIRVTTSADLKGYRDLQTEMNKMIQQAKEYTSLMHSVGKVDSGSMQVAAGGELPGGAAYSDGGASFSGRAGAGRSVRRRSGQRDPYNMDTSSGVAQYYENVLMPAMNTIDAVSKRSKVTTIGGIKYQPPSKGSVTPVSDSQISQWFSGLMDQVNGMDMEVRKAYLNSAFDSSSRPSAVKDFYAQYGNLLNGPQPQIEGQSLSFGSRLMQHFSNNLQGKSLGGALIGGLKGAVGGTILDAAVGGGEAGAVAGSAGAGALGFLEGGPLGAVAALGIQTLFSTIGSTISQGMKSFSETIPAFSQLSHALDNATNSAIGFQQNVQFAGARVAMTPMQSTQAAQTLAGVFGNTLGNKGLANLVQQTGAAALINGIDPNTMATITATAASLGVTSGRGSSMSPDAFNKMLLNMTQQSGMQGRQQSLYTGLLSVYGGLQSMSPSLTAANATAAQYTAMNASGIQGLQGQSGANILSTMNSNIGSGQGLGGIMSMAAIYQGSGGKISNPWQMRSVMEQGLGAQVGNTTLGSQLVKMVQQMAPGDIYTQAGILSSAAGISENQAIAMLRSGALNAQSISEKNGQTTRYTVSDVNTAGTAALQVETGRLADITSAAKAGVKVLGGTPYSVNVAGQTTSLYANPNSPQPSPTKPHQGMNARTGFLPPGSASIGVSGAPIDTYVGALLQGIMYQESRGNPYSINDNSTGKPGVGTSYQFSTKAAYLAEANKLTKAGHQLALGPFQLENFHKGVTPESAINMSYASSEASSILFGDYNTAKKAGAKSPWATALEDYSDDYPGYAKDVLAYAGGILNQPTSNPLDLSENTINALARAIAREEAIYLSHNPTR